MKTILVSRGEKESSGDHESQIWEVHSDGLSDSAQLILLVLFLHDGWYHRLGGDSNAHNFGGLFSWMPTASIDFRSHWES